MQLKNFELSEKDFERFRRLISQSSGIYFDRGKWDLLRLGLAERAEAVGAPTLTDYYEQITGDPHREEELRRLLAHLSVQETQFYRNLPQFDALRKYVIPEIVKRKAASGSRSLRFWSAGCSTGQEPYSIAMSVLDVLPDARDWNIQVLGTDLNEDALSIADAGWYPEKKLTGIDRAHRNSYFRQQDGGYVVTEPVKRLVHLARHNMVTEPLPINVFGTCDVIFCRNVIIYFTHETAKYVIELFYDILNPGGFLFLGHSETLWKMSAKYSLVEVGDAFIYKKSLPRSLEGRRFIADRRMRKGPLPPGVTTDRRQLEERRNASTTRDMLVIPGGAAVGGEKANREVEALRMVDEGRAFLELGEYEKAVEILTRSVQEHKTCGDANFLLGVAHEKRNDLEEAADYFRKTVYCDETHSLAYFHMANVMERLGKLKTAVREYRNAAHRLRQDDPSRWEKDLDSYDLDSLISLCEWKIENLGAVEG